MNQIMHALTIALPIVLCLYAIASLSPGIGRALLSNNVVPPTRVSADGSPRFKPGGATIDWTTIVAVGVDTVLPEGGGAVIKAGQKYLRFGQVLTKITATGWYGPYDPAAVDGRQLLNRGDCYVLDETITEYTGGVSQFTAHNDHIGGLIDGGLIFIDRVLQSGVSAHSLAAGPTLAEFLAAFPTFRIARD